VILIVWKAIACFIRVIAVDTITLGRNRHRRVYALEIVVYTSRDCIIAKGLVFKQDDSIGSGPSPSWRIHTLNEGARTALPVYRLEPLAAQV
jgi:hypothetical protein